ncbi:hypothetical protein GJG85_20750 [Burkholderia sp. MS389]|uniref:hypothetical protein n=1 Tax=Burkholderia sp. MS389 TaxID=2811789 RepID=UPI00195B7B6E|nr:hypothetical protein [Burkholderia sp. MS389]QRR15830.1 hypothetical protein GJG85_20750 [Burkholderia sp. MS389]
MKVKVRKLRRNLLALVLASIGGRVYADSTYEVAGASLKIGDSKICSLDRRPRYAIESFDKSAVMLSETTYVDKRQLDRCQTGIAVHVLSIPPRVGVLSDINISKGIYVALDFVDVQPFSYLATVARVGTSKNIVSLKGAYVAGKKLSELRGTAFNSGGEAGASIISPDGRYVAPTGEMDCSETSYPGVWDIKNNRRVVVADDVCAGLFKK